MVNDSKTYGVPVVHTRLKPGRERGQNGWLEVTGKSRKRWRGHFYTYEAGANGVEMRRHRSVLLGYRSEMTRKQAADSLRQAIAMRAETKIDDRLKMTFGQFWRERYLPLYEKNWRTSSRRTQIDNIERYCVSLLDEVPLLEIDRFRLQKTANCLAEQFSHSVVSKFVIWTRAILEEAIDQDFLTKNPARKLTTPETRAENKRFLTMDEIPRVLSRLPIREELILRMTLVLGLRPGELFALQWNDVDGYSLRLDEATVDGKIYPTLKTKQSRGYVAVPASLRSGLANWKAINRPRSEKDLIFPNSRGGVYRVDNYRADVLRPALKRIEQETGIDGIDFRACRRTCATLLSQHGGVKEVQAHLRHSRATTTLEVYIQEVPEAVRNAVERLDAVLAVARKSKGDGKNS
jgi:integrase